MNIERHEARITMALQSLDILRRSHPADRHPASAEPQVEVAKLIDVHLHRLQGLSGGLL